jgi:hypothetical protein
MAILVRATIICIFVFVDCVLCSGRDDARPVEAILCDVYQHPEQYDGKMVKVRAAVIGIDFRDDLWIEDFAEKSCPAYMRVIVVLPEQVKPAPQFELVRDKSFKDFEDALHDGKRVNATFEGRLDAAFHWRDRKRIAVGDSQAKGYGKKHGFDGRVVLHQVSDVVAKTVPSK